MVSSSVNSPKVSGHINGSLTRMLFGLLCFMGLLILAAAARVTKIKVRRFIAEKNETILRLAKPAILEATFKVSIFEKKLTACNVKPGAIGFHSIF